jgi:hypothetical protein
MGGRDITNCTDSGTAMRVLCILASMISKEEEPMEDKQLREGFDTGLGKIRHEIKSRLVPHGFFGNVTHIDTDLVDQVPTGSKIEIVVKGRAVERSFSRQDIEGCRLRVGGAVLVGIISMIDELAA